MNLIVFSILGLLVLTAVMIARLRDLWACIMATGIYSFLGASWMLLLDAPDVAFTEAAVGAGISTVLMLTTISLTGCRSIVGKCGMADPIEVESEPSGDQDSPDDGSESALSGRPATNPGRRFIAFVVVTITGLALIYGTLDMPHYGDPDAPIQTYPSPSFVERSQGDMHGLPNVVTAVLASYRGYDTFGETTVILTAGVSVLLILRRRPAMDDTDSGNPIGEGEGA